MLRDWGAPGAAVSVVKDGQIVFSKGYGVLELGRPQRVDQNTLFGIGSMSKTFTATIVARLVEQGRLGWDDRIIDHLPTFRLADPWVTAHVTIRDVLTHRVGLDEAGNNAIWAFQSVDREQYVSRLRHVPLTGRFRDTFTYSNGLLTMTGELLEAVAGKSWEELIAAEVFAPLGMTRSVSGRDKLVAPGHWVPNWFGRPPEGALKGQAGLRPGVTNVAAPHGLDRHGRRILYYWHYKPESAPAGAVTSSAHDMGLYMLAYLGEGGFLEPATLHEMLGLQSRHEAPEEGSPQRRLGWGLGWEVSDYRGHAAVGHLGGQVGYMSRMVLIPAEKLGVSVLVNDNFSLLPKMHISEVIAFRLLDHALGLRALDLHNLPRRKPLESERPTEQRMEHCLKDLAPHRTRAALPLEQYAGHYVHPANGDVDIALEGKRLVFRFAPLLTGELVHETGEIFRLRFDSESAAQRGFDVTFSFSSDWKTRPGSLTLRGLRGNKWVEVDHFLLKAEAA